MRWVVFVKRPYYPSVEGEYDTEAEAMKAARELAGQENDESGLHESKVYVAKIVAVLPIKTHY